MIRRERGAWTISERLRLANDPFPVVWETGKIAVTVGYF